MRTDNTLAKIRRYFSKVQRAARAFKKQRSTYYEYLADMLGDSDGLIVDLFRKDAIRYANKPRGILSSYWAERFSGDGNLVGTWSATLPDADLMLIASASQNGGTSALPSALREIARLTRVMDEAKSNFYSVIAVGLFALLLTGASLMSVSLVIWPNLQDTFSFVDPAFYGERTRRMQTFAKELPGYSLALIALLSWLALTYQWSLSNWTGKLRCWADRNILLYRLNRDFKGAMLVSTLATMVRRRVATGRSLTDALNIVSEHANPWLQWYCARITEKLRHGISGAHAFDVGLLDTQTLYYLLDVSEARSLNEGLEAAGLRTERDIAKTVNLRARILKIVLLVMGLLTALSVSLWTSSVVYELVDSAKASFQS